MNEETTDDPRCGCHKTMNRLPDEWLDEAELSLLASGYTPNADLQDCSEWSARQVAEIALTDDLIGMIVAVPRVERDAALAEVEKWRLNALVAQRERDANSAEIDRMVGELSVIRMEHEAERKRIVAAIKAMPSEPCSDYEDASQLIWRDDAIAIVRGGTDE